MKIKDLIGIAASATVVIVGLAFAPRVRHGWDGTCPWSEVFPIHGALLPDSRSTVFDGCESGPAYMVALIPYLVLVFLASGMVANRIAERPSRSRGVLVNVSLGVATLVFLWIVDHEPFNVGATFLVAAACLVVAAGLGFVTGPHPKR